MPKIYNARHLAIEVERFDGTVDCYLRIHQWMKECGDTGALADEVTYTTPLMMFHAAGGAVAVRPGEYVARGDGNVFYVIEPKVLMEHFDSTP